MLEGSLAIQELQNPLVIEGKLLAIVSQRISDMYRKEHEESEKIEKT